MEFSSNGNRKRFTNIVQLGKDTTISSYTYKFFKTVDGWGGYLRESEDKSKIYFLSFGKERLIMDLNLNLNDTFLIGGNNRKILVDSVFFENGRKHIRFNYWLWSPILDKLEFIEGIGSNYGMFILSWLDTNYYTFSQQYVLCSYKDGEQVYFTNHPFLKGRCYIASSYECRCVSIADKKIGISHSLSPNPIQNTSTLSIRNSNQTPLELYIYDNLGRKIETQYTDGETFTISANAKESGLYLYQLRSKGQILLSDKFIVIK